MQEIHLHRHADTPFVGLDRRSIRNRRYRSTRVLSRHSHKGKRQHARRAEDKQSNGYYIDRYGPKLLLACVAILLLCLADAYFTIQIINSGGEELNALMDMLIRESILIFIVSKYFMTSGSLIFLVAHRNFTVCCNKLKVTHVIAGLLFIYIVLIGYEINILQANSSFSIL